MMNLFNPTSNYFTPLVKETDPDKGGGIIGDSPLSLVVRTNEVETAYILLKEFKTDPNTINCEGKSPLDLAKEIGNEKMIKLLEVNGAKTAAKLCI